MAKNGQYTDKNEADERHNMAKKITFAFQSDTDEESGASPVSIDFPQVTLCKEWGFADKIFPEFPVLQECANGSHGFLMAVENCLNNKPDFDLDRFIRDVKNVSW